MVDLNSYNLYVRCTTYYAVVYLQFTTTLFDDSALWHIVIRNVPSPLKV